jgi:hypothetical protein
VKTKDFIVFEVIISVSRSVARRIQLEIENPTSSVCATVN